LCSLNKESAMNKDKINKLRSPVTLSLNNLTLGLIEVCSKRHTDGQVKSVIFQQKLAKKNLKHCQ
jgi:hypothetical protein